VVQGTFPGIQADHNINVKANWYNQADLKTYHETYPKELQKQVNQSRAGHSVLNNNFRQPSTEADQIQKAIEESLLSTTMNHTKFGDDDDIQMALTRSMDVQMSDKDDPIITEKEKSPDEEELEKAVLLSLQSEYEAKVPKEPDESVESKDICELKLRLAKNETLDRKFLKENTIGDVFNFIKSKSSHQGDLELICPPHLVYKEENKKLGELPDLGGKATLTVRFIKPIDKDQEQT